MLPPRDLPFDSCFIRTFPSVAFPVHSVGSGQLAFEPFAGVPIQWDLSHIVVHDVDRLGIAAVQAKCEYAPGLCHTFSFCNWYGTFSHIGWFWAAPCAFVCLLFLFPFPPKKNQRTFRGWCCSPVDLSHFPGVLICSYLPVLFSSIIFYQFYLFISSGFLFFKKKKKTISFGRPSDVLTENYSLVSRICSKGGGGFVIKRMAISAHL